jgi:hypothetical protein
MKYYAVAELDVTDPSWVRDTAGRRRCFGV